MLEEIISSPPYTRYTLTWGFHANLQSQVTLNNLERHADTIFGKND